ncbi:MULTISPECIES: ATP-binding cassette domain-containing protein [Catenuloplanes]|uniref:ATP-binding cassette domain-containing protein n=1 Tax=Catenuloplanes TaxID=33874 RepID=UPI00286C5D60|nr:ATP-binding cassette domain-containing protein [Catenuloplanes niger]
MISALTATGLGKRYGRRTALAGVDLDVPAGRIVGLVGPNGAGKTTLLGLAAGLLTPTEGELPDRGPGTRLRPPDRARRRARPGRRRRRRPADPARPDGRRPR